MHSTNSFINFKNMRFYFYCLPVFLFLPALLMAQRDTTKKQSINIVSSFKPALRTPVKISFSGSQLPADTSRAVKEYVIPSQNLFYAYQAIPLTPLALQQDSNLYLGSRNFIKAGFGNYNTPYANIGLGLGDGKTMLVNVYGSYISSQGRIKNQDYSMLDVKATGSYFMKNNEVYAFASASRDQYFLYGYDHSLFDPKRNDIRQQFQQINLAGGIRNTVSTRYKISYNPHVQANFFTNKDKLTETTVIVDVPVKKKFGKSFLLNIDAKADLTRYSTIGFIPSNYNIDNNVIQVMPSLVYNSPGLIINAGMIPVWNNDKFEYLPNVYAEGRVKEKVFMIQAGWTGRITKNTYRNLSAINPYLALLTEQKNTKEIEFYGGIKATVGSHFNFNAKAGIVHYKDFALFINDNGASGIFNGFKISNESVMHNVRIHGDISYISQDKFTATANLTLNGYTGMQDNAKAWNTVPMEFTGSLRWWPFNKLLLKGDFYMFGGGHYLEEGNKSRTFSGGFDVSAGIEYKINKQFGAFINVNNIFDNRYQRWHGYEVYGLNLLGGIIIHF